MVYIPVYIQFNLSYYYYQNFPPIYYLKSTSLYTMFFVAAVLPDEIPGVADNPVIVDLLAIDSIGEASVRVSGAGIGIL